MKPRTESASSDSDKRRVLIVDDHPVFRAGLASLINAHPDLVTWCEASSAPLAIHLMRTSPSDIAVLDTSLPGVDSIDLIKSLKAEHPEVKILMLSMYEEPIYVLRALQAGALGCVMKSEPLDHIRAALHKIAKGETYLSPKLRERGIFRAFHKGSVSSPLEELSPKELEVFKLFGRGLGTRAVASLLNVSVKTIETHRMRIKQKLGFKDAKEMVRFAVDWEKRGTFRPDL